jgi:ACS family glucarate transporter-like MFS transporter
VRKRTDLERPTRVRFLLAFWLFVLSAVSFLDRTNISIAGLQISHEYGLGNQRLGWIFSAFLVGYAGFQVPAGILVARFGPRQVLSLGVLWWGIATALTAMLPASAPHAVALLLVIRFALGAGESVIYPAASQFVARWIPQKERGFVNGLIFAGVGAGSGLTPPLLSAIIAGHGWRAAFWFSAVCGWAAAIVWWLLARDSPEQHPAVSTQELCAIERGRSSPLPGDHELPGRSTVSVWRAVVTRKDLTALVIGYFSFGYIAWVFFSWFFLYMAQVRGFDLKSSARYTMLPFLCMTAFCLAGGVVSDYLVRTRSLRVGRCYLASGALILTAIFLVFGSQVHSSRLAAVVLAGGAGALYLSQSSFWSVSADIAGDHAGLFSSFINTGGQLGGALTASLTPWIAKHFGWTVSFSTAACLALIGALCWLTVHPERAMIVGVKSR